MTDERTYRDRAQYNIAAVDKRRKKLKSMAIEYRGGKCNVCGYNKYIEALDFYHVDEKQKNLVYRQMV